jgi:hypothetical protein
MRFKSFVFCVLLICPLLVTAQTGSIYSGGMLVFQPGITLTNNGHQDISAGSGSVGGILRMYFGSNLTAGIYGGSQTTHYQSIGSDDSFFKIGYGGPFFGYSKLQGKFRYTASLFAGMGSVTNLHIDTHTGDQLGDAWLHKSSTVLFSPIISVDYAITNRLFVTAQTICLTGKYDLNKWFYNPTLQFGILFSR